MFSKYISDCGKHIRELSNVFLHDNNPWFFTEIYVRVWLSTRKVLSSKSIIITLSAFLIGRGIILWSLNWFLFIIGMSNSRIRRLFMMVPLIVATCWISFSLFKIMYGVSSKVIATSLRSFFNCSKLINSVKSPYNVFFSEFFINSMYRSCSDDNRMAVEDIYSKLIWFLIFYVTYLSCQFINVVIQFLYVFLYVSKVWLVIPRVCFMIDILFSIIRFCSPFWSISWFK